MTLDELLGIIGNKIISSQICADSRLVVKGDVFVAIKGSQFDGYDFINDAIKNGAGYIVSKTAVKTDKVKVILTKNTSIALGLLAQKKYGSPADKMTNLAITGTNGKTTVTFLLRSVINSAGKNCGLIGTIYNDTDGGGIEKSALTTPDAIEIAELGAKMVRAKTAYMAIEASSHAIVQNRLAGINFAAAAFTNLTGDHLDYHKTIENYLAAKTKLFAELSPQSFAILNSDDNASKTIAQQTKAKKIFYGLNSTADISASIESMDISGTVFTISYQGEKCKVKTPLLGKYNISNHLAAAGLCLATGFSLAQIAEGLSKLTKVPGRLERVDSARDFAVLIDYAHTDDALKNVLSTLKPLCKGRLCVVFGCGGDRDKTKRPRMAKVAQALADTVIVTNDNPRTEDSGDIIKDIFDGFDEPDKKSISAIPDRRNAIEYAVKNAATGDIILIAGKGHEDYQIIGREKIRFSDNETAGEFLR
ncbi:MAG: UDP-N-acetylmuramoyl-L-alanyl-D-glutamate--2,6-diaminopimelate ligase [Anaerohalosphaeraceae bacterium]|nr:UDP-N-acetylmuramoyl-L-alanyl-D-glutamate--2,6-diaminopimelate ligase [Anaerohalosphaeraceae bacterium]